MNLDGHQFLFLTGKGGVGKTTTSLALGRYFAAQGRKVVVASSKGNSQLLTLVRLPEAPEPTEVSKNLFVCAIDPESAMRQYVEHQLHSAALTQILFQKSIAKGFLDGIPGLRQWALLGKAWALSEPDAPGPKLNGAPFDLVIFDAPSTGDSTELLKLPRLITDLIPKSPLSRDAARCQKLFENSSRFALLVVTLAEDLPVTETLELLDTMKRDLRLGAHGLVVNRVLTRYLGEDLSNRLIKDDAPEATETTQAVLEVARRRALLEASEESQLERLRREGLPLLCIRELSPGPSRLEELDGLVSEPIFDQIETPKRVILTK